MSKKENTPPVFDSENPNKLVKQTEILPLAKDSIVFGNTTTNKQQKSQEQASDNVTSNLDKILEMMRQEIIGKQNLLFQEILLNIQEEEEQKKYIKGLSPQEFKAELQNNPNLEEQIKSVLASKTEIGLDFKNRLEQIESQGYKKVHEEFKDDFREIPWNTDIGVSDLRSTEIKNESGEVLCDLSEQVVSNKKTDVKLNNGETISVSSYRQIDFPQSLNPGTTGPMHLSMAVKDENGHNIAEKDAVYFSAHYNEQGKLVEVSSPQPVKFAGKGDDAIGYIEKDGKIYTLPVTKGKYQMMQQEVQKNQGQSINLASTLESNIEPELAKTQDVYNFKEKENIRTKEQDKDNPSLLQENIKQNQLETRNISNEVSLLNEGTDVRQDLGRKKEKSMDEKIARVFGEKGLKQYKDKQNQPESRESILSSEPVTKKGGFNNPPKVKESISSPKNVNLSQNNSEKISGKNGIKQDKEQLNQSETIERRNASLSEPVPKQKVFNNPPKVKESISSPKNVNLSQSDIEKIAAGKPAKQVINKNKELNRPRSKTEFAKNSSPPKLMSSTELAKSLSDLETNLQKAREEYKLDQQVEQLYKDHPSLLQENGKQNQLQNNQLQNNQFAPLSNSTNVKSEMERDKAINNSTLQDNEKQNEFRPRRNAISLSSEEAEELRQDLGIKTEKNTDEKIANLFGDEGLKQYKDKQNQSDSIEGIELQELEKKPSMGEILNDSIKMRSSSEDLDDFNKVINVDNTRINASLPETVLKQEGLGIIQEVDEALEEDEISRSSINSELSKIQEVDNSKQEDINHIEKQEPLERRNTNVAELSDQVDSGLAQTENIKNVEMTKEQVQIERQKLEQEIDLEDISISQNEIGSVAGKIKSNNKLLAPSTHEEAESERSYKEFENSIS